MASSPCRRRSCTKGPAAHDWPDQTWALSRPKTLIGRRFHKIYPVQGVATPLKRHNWSCQVPARQALEHNEAEWPAGGGGGKSDLASEGKDRGSARRLAVFEEEARCSINQLTTRTWSAVTAPMTRTPGRSRRRYPSPPSSVIRLTQPPG